MASKEYGVLKMRDPCQWYDTIPHNYYRRYRYTVNECRFYSHKINASVFCGILQLITQKQQQKPQQNNLMELNE